MSKVHSHYENLKVARNAPPEVIQGAYRYLSKKYHPDKSRGDPDATRIMALLNVAYAVLSDPVQRREHDTWLASQEAVVPPISAAPEKRTGHSKSNSPQRQAVTPEPQTTSYTDTKLNGGIGEDYAKRVRASVTARLRQMLDGFLEIVRTIVTLGAITVIVVFAVNAWLNNSTVAPTSGKLAKPIAQKVQPAAYSRPALGPDGHSWPSFSGYLVGFQQLHADGLSKITIDNTRGDSDIFVKFVSLSDSPISVARTPLVTRNSSFSLLNVTPGRYELRYRDLTYGNLARSEPFDLTEQNTHDGTTFSNMSLTLYKVRSGNSRTFPLSEADF